MKSSSILAIMALAAVSAVAVAATNPQASFDVQLKQAQVGIQAIADAGVMKSAGSFDTQLNQAKARIDQIAAEGRAATPVVAGK